jgi:hypothetical protein
MFKTVAGKTALPSYYPQIMVLIKKAGHKIQQ